VIGHALLRADLPIASAAAAAEPAPCPRNPFSTVRTPRQQRALVQRTASHQNQIPYPTAVAVFAYASRLQRDNSNMRRGSSAVSENLWMPKGPLPLTGGYLIPSKTSSPTHVIAASVPRSRESENTNERPSVRSLPFIPACLRIQEDLS
jgi:hypothetical protein